MTAEEQARLRRRWETCHVAGAGGLCGKPAHNPTPGFLGFCYEHSAHGTCCRCGHFWIDASLESGRVEHAGVRHTAFACVPAPET